MKKYAFLFFSLLFFLSCGDDQNNQNQSVDITTDTTAQVVLQNVPTRLIVGLDHLRLREKAGEAGKEIAMLKKGTILYETGEVSNFSSRIKLRGVWFEEPWVKVKTEDGIEGWVFTGAVTFDIQNPTAFSEKILDTRLKSFFGNTITDESHSYRKAYYSAKTSEDFSKVYKTGEQLRDKMVTILEKKIDVTQLDYEKLPDLFWVEESIPGYETALVAEGTIYYLLKNFKTFQKTANKTSGKEDDDFIELNIKVHESDSIEYFFPAWFLQTWDYGGHSLLGQGVHLSILTLADKNLKKSDMFLDETIKIKNEILDDIAGKEITYWEPAAKAKKELDDILKANLSILTSEDKILIETRKAMFDDPKANGIEVNHKAGMN